MLYQDVTPLWHHCLLLWHWKMHSDQSPERWIWPISCRKCWCTPPRSDCSSHSFHFQLYSGWRNAETCRTLDCLYGGEKKGKVTHLLPTWLPCHLREAFIENVKRAHFQAALWRSISVIPELSPEEYGWKRDTANKTLCPISLPDNTKPAPDYILEIIKCGCKTDTPCSTKKCSCRVKGLPLHHILCIF